jgi:hypothetical protein
MRKCQLCGTLYPSEFDALCEADEGDSWSYWCDKHSKAAQESGCEDCAYEFEGRSYFTPEKLGEGLFQNWEFARRETATLKISDWLIETGRDKLLAGKLREIEQLEELTPDDRVSLVIMVLLGDSVLRWQGQAVEFGTLQHHEELGVSVLSGRLPELMAALGIGAWLLEIKNHWSWILEEHQNSNNPHVDSFRLLFNTAPARDLKTALMAATLVPRFNVAAAWSRRAGALATMAATGADTGFEMPNRLELKKLFQRISSGLKAGKVFLSANKDYLQTPLLLSWPFQGKTLIENEMFRNIIGEYLDINQETRLLQTLVFGYLRDFDAQKGRFVSLLAALITEFLEKGNSGEFKKWRLINDRIQIFSGSKAPEYCAKALNPMLDIESGLNEFGLKGHNLGGGFSSEVLLKFIEQTGPFDLDLWEKYRTWFEKCARAFHRREYRWVESLASAYQAHRADGIIRTVVSRYLVNRYGEPDQCNLLWNACSDHTRELFLQWLLFENLEKFFELIADYSETTGGEMRMQWGYRKAFWLAVHRTGVVSDVRIAVGRGLMDKLGEARLKEKFGSKVFKFNDGDERRCALLLQVGPFTIVDFTHNAKCRIWETRDEHKLWFKETKLKKNAFQGGSDLRIKSHYETTGISHFSSETYGWQDAVAEFLKPYLPEKLPRSSYQFRE